MPDTLAQTEVAAPLPAAVSALDSVPGPTIERAGADCYIVLDEGRPTGFVDVVGPVFVALHGGHYHRAVEVGQTHDLDGAAALIVAAEDAQTSRRRTR